MNSPHFFLLLDVIIDFIDNIEDKFLNKNIEIENRKKNQCNNVIYKEPTKETIHDYIKIDIPDCM